MELLLAAAAAQESMHPLGPHPWLPVQVCTTVGLSPQVRTECRSPEHVVHPVVASEPESPKPGSDESSVGPASPPSPDSWPKPGSGFVPHAEASPNAAPMKQATET